MSNLSSGDANIINRINNDEYTLFDKILYGGLGYGHFCLPANIFKILITIFFPPLGVLIHNMGDPKNEFPYISIDNIKNMAKGMDQFIISIILSSLWLPGVIYALNLYKTDNTDKNKIESKNNFKNTSPSKNKTSKRRRRKNNDDDDDDDDDDYNDNTNKYTAKDLDLIRKRLDID